MSEERIIEQEGITLNLDGQGQMDAETGIPFLNHLLEAFGKHGQFDLSLPPQASATKEVTKVLFTMGEQIGLAFAEARKRYLEKPCSGHFILPMDDTLVQVTIDLQSERPYLLYDATVKHPLARSFDFRDVEQFFKGFA